MHQGRIFVPFAVAIAALSTACGGVPHYAPTPGLSAEPLPVLVWVADHPRLSKEDALAGCGVWSPKGVVCALTSDKNLADLRVYADPPCPRGEDGRRTLATAYHGGRIVMRTDCFTDDGKFDRHAFRAVFAHEVGHQMGIWEHVAEECDHDARRLPSDQRVCGQAIMNPLYDKDVYFMTPVDARAFDVRNKNYAVVHDDGDRHDPAGDRDAPICVFITPPE